MTQPLILNRRAFAALLGLGSAALFGVRPDAANATTIAEIKARKKLIVGVLIDFPPFGGTDNNQKPAGYDVDVSKLMARDLGVELEIVPVTGPNRIPYLLTNKIDMLVATFGITQERSKQVLFSNPYSAIDIYLVAPKSMKISGPDDLKGLKIGVARASTQDTAISAIAPKEARIMRFDDDASALQSILSRQVDVLGCSNVALAQLNTTAPQLDLEPKITLRRQANGIAFRKDDTDQQAWVNQFLAKVAGNGELDAINRRWFNQPLGKLPDMPTF